MDMKISGKGKITEGEYGRIRIRGGGKLFGNVRYSEELKASPKAKIGRIEKI